MHLFLDLDGTLLDSTQRLYQLFNFLVPESDLSFIQYWELKKNAIGHAAILKDKFNYSPASIIQFQQQWHNLIEHPDWIAYDKPLAGVTEKLIDLSERYSLILVTARQFVTIAKQQVEQFEWKELFDELLITEQKTEKENLILQNIRVFKDDWFIGDTGKDILAGKFLKINTAAVLSGFRSRENLVKYSPDIIIRSITDFNN